MALQGIGVSISLGDISNEFGASVNNSLGNYRIVDTISGSGLGNLPLDEGIPTSVAAGSSQISLSDFYGKRLNVVVDCYSSTGVGTESLVNAKEDKWDNNETVVVGRLRSKKEAGSKIRIAVNKRFMGFPTHESINKVQGDPPNTGVGVANTNQCALRTGSWDSTAILIVEVGSSGEILGAGGKGGDGADGISNNGDKGGSGTSALGIEYDGTIVNVASGGVIRAGFGGGGGGGGGRETSKKDRRAGGGGGGGGAGFPYGLGGKGGEPQAGTNRGGSSIGTDGDDGTPTAGGFGRGGGDNDDQAGGGNGGDGGDDETIPTEGENKSTEGHTKPPGSRGLGGQSGAAIRTKSGVSFTLNNSGSVIGFTTTANVL